MPSVDVGPFAAEAFKLAADERRAAELAERRRLDAERQKRLRDNPAPTHGYCSDRSCRLHHHDAVVIRERETSE